MSATQPTAEDGAIERRFGATAASEFQVLLNQVELAEEFALVVLVVPDMEGARLCQGELQAWLGQSGRHLTVIEPESPAALHEASGTLFSIPDDPARRAIWIAAAHGPPNPNAAAWDLAWRHALVGLNQQRNPLRRRFPLPLILVGTPSLVSAMREIAADLWSVRSLSLRIEPGQEAIEIEPSYRPEPEALTRSAAPDPELALRMADRVRGHDGQEQTLAFLLARAGEGFAARSDWNRAEAAWRDAVDMFERFGPLQAAAWTWVELADRWYLTGHLEIASDAYAKALQIRERMAHTEPDRADYQRDLSVSYNRMGDLYRALGQGEAARDAFAKALAIAERLARTEPDRTDYQHVLSVSYSEMGDMYRALGQGEAARDFYLKDLDIAERLARAEPERADYQRDLILSLLQQAPMTDGEAARAHLQRALGIAEALQASGRLAPTDAGLLTALQNALGAMR
jgi:tetratricopeptide (TPR) repeat protein